MWAHIRTNITFQQSFFKLAALLESILLFRHYSRIFNRQQPLFDTFLDANSHLRSLSWRTRTLNTSLTRQHASQWWSTLWAHSYLPVYCVSIPLELVLFLSRSLCVADTVLQFAGLCLSGDKRWLPNVDLPIADLIDPLQRAWGTGWKDIMLFLFYSEQPFFQEPYCLISLSFSALSLDLFHPPSYSESNQTNAVDVYPRR